MVIECHDKVRIIGNVLLQEPHVQRDKERLAKKLDAPKETFVMPEVAKYDSFNLLLFCGEVCHL